MKYLLAAWLFSVSLLAQAADTRFDSMYFFQSESVLQQKGINVDSLGRYMRAVQSRVYKLLKSAKLPPSSGYLVIAIRSDGEVASWLDMQPVIHEYYDNQIFDTIQKIQPLEVNNGIVVFAIKMAVDTAVFTKKAVPAPPDWADARKKIADPNNIEQLVLSIWPE